MQDQPPKSSVHSRSLGQSWLALPARTRLYISLGFCALGAAGMFVSDRLEKGYPAQKKSEENK